MVAATKSTQLAAQKSTRKVYVFMFKDKLPNIENREGLGGVAEVADYLGLKPTTLNKWRWLGCGPNYIKVGSSVRYRWEDVEAWLSARTTGGVR
jgi:hypothetical protein